MTLEQWERNGWLREHKTSPRELADLLSLVERDLKDAMGRDISLDWRYNIAYNAGLQLATTILRATGYRPGRGESQHYRTIQAIPHVMGESHSEIRDFFDNARRKRNISEYDAAGTVSEKETMDLIDVVRDFRVRGEIPSPVWVTSCV